MKPLIRIGSRGSPLALAQARDIQRRLARKFPRFRFSLEVVPTTGDEFQSVEIFKKTNIGVFTKAIEKRLMSGEIDIAVHSLKDLPTHSPKGLCLAAFPKRLNSQDVLVSRKRHSLKTLPPGALVGTGSPRRKSQLALARPDLRLVDIRGNLGTRIKKVIHEKKMDAVVIARAGLVRLKKYLRYASPLDNTQILPAVGQGALGIQTRKKDRRVRQMLQTLNHPQTEKEVLAERVFLRTLGGGCRVPVGIYSRIQNHRIHLTAAVFSVKDRQYVRSKINGPVKHFKKIAVTLAKKLLKMGAAHFLRQAREEIA